jgi:ADP-dependent NAD(P)H-hydrate dehydratase
MEITEQFLREMPLPNPEEGDKGTRGNVLVIAGGRDVPGAALLSGVAALRAGAGRLQIATSFRHASNIAIAIPEALVVGLPETKAGGIEPAAIDALSPMLERADAVLLGPGLQDDEAIASLTRSIFDTVKPGPSFVVDAGAIKHLGLMTSTIAPHGGRVVVTPHAGEMAALMKTERSTVEADQARIAQEVAVEHSIVVALKGAETFIASPHDAPIACRRGNVGLATSGAGDVLAGLITGLLARGARPFVAACWGVFLHANAGDYLSRHIGPLGFLARELSTEIPRIMGALSSRSGTEEDASGSAR